jgi:hypothetical protein
VQREKDWKNEEGKNGLGLKSFIDAENRSSLSDYGTASPEAVQLKVLLI